jgi:hypothetical protein
VAQEAVKVVAIVCKGGELSLLHICIGSRAFTEAVKWICREYCGERYIHG